MKEASRHKVSEKDGQRISMKLRDMIPMHIVAFSKMTETMTNTE